MSNIPLNLTRQQLQAMTPNQRALRAMEQLLKQNNTDQPDQIDAATLSASEALSQAAETQSSLARIANALELIATQPQANNSQSADYFDLLTQNTHPAYREGRLFYDQSDHSLAYHNDAANCVVNIGREQVVRIYNNTGSTITAGQVVYVNGASSGAATVSLAQANNSTSYTGTIGLATKSIANNAFGYVTSSGIIADIDTSSYSVGQTLYLSSSVAGGWTTTKPTQPNYVIWLGYVITSSTTGSVLVRVDRDAWFSNLDIRSTAASTALPTTPTLFKPATTAYSDGFGYDSSTGVITVNNSGSYVLSATINASPSAANKKMYFYLEESPDGTTWTIDRYSARQLELINGTETQMSFVIGKYYPTGTRIRFYLWGDATVTLKTTDLPGTTAGTVTMPAFILTMA